MGLKLNISKVYYNSEDLLYKGNNTVRISRFANTKVRSITVL